MIGEFEYLVLAASAALGNDAYGASIRRHIQDLTGRACSIGALYVTLDRLEAKGLLRTHMGDATPERGGRARRMVRITPRGTREAAAFYQTVQNITRSTAWESSR